MHEQVMQTNYQHYGQLKNRNHLVSEHTFQLKEEDV